MAKKSTRKFGSIKDLDIAVTEVAELFEVDKNSVCRQVREQGLPKSTFGSYPAWDVIKWYLQRLRAASKPEATASLSDERRKLIISQRKHKELEADRIRGTLLDADLVSTAIHEMGGIFASQLDGLAPRVASRLSTETDPGTIQRILFDECRAIRRATAEAVTAFANDNFNGNPPDASPEKGRGAVGRRESSPPARKPRTRTVED